MTSLCIDANLVVKWFLDEPGSELARSLPDRFDLIAPDILPVEVAHALRRRVVARELDAVVASEIVSLLADLPIQLRRSQGVLADAFEFALRFRRGIYDSLYACVALEEDCRCVTADLKFYEATVGAFPATMVFIDQIPELPR